MEYNSQELVPENFTKHTSQELTCKHTSGMFIEIKYQIGMFSEMEVDTEDHNLILTQRMTLWTQLSKRSSLLWMNPVSDVMLMSLVRWNTLAHREILRTGIITFCDRNVS